jgi:hypothetical protein
MMANIVSHTRMLDLYRISAADGIVRDHSGFTYVGKSFGQNDMTGCIRLESDAEYPGAMMDRYAGLVMKCKSLRGRLQSIRARGGTVLGNFSSKTEGIKFSGLYRKLHRDDRDASLPGPPAYFTRRRDGIPVPALGVFMTGYKNLFKMDIQSKTLENSYLVMNRQVWTNEKSTLSGVGGGPGGGGG